METKHSLEADQSPIHWLSKENSKTIKQCFFWRITVLMEICFHHQLANWMKPNFSFIFIKVWCSSSMCDNADSYLCSSSLQTQNSCFYIRPTERVQDLAESLTPLRQREEPNLLHPNRWLTQISNSGPTDSGLDSPTAHQTCSILFPHRPSEFPQHFEMGLLHTIFIQKPFVGVFKDSTLSMWRRKEHGFLLSEHSGITSRCDWGITAN